MIHPVGLALSLSIVSHLEKPVKTSIELELSVGVSCVLV